MKTRELNECLMFNGYYNDAKDMPRTPHGRELTGEVTTDIDVIIPKVRNDTDIIGVTLTDEQARLISFCITNSWPELSEDEKITAQKLLTRVNKIYEED